MADGLSEFFNGIRYAKKKIMTVCCVDYLFGKPCGLYYYSIERLQRGLADEQEHQMPGIQARDLNNPPKRSCGHMNKKAPSDGHIGKCSELELIEKIMECKKILERIYWGEQHH
jgi:hypothetical protein